MQGFKDGLPKLELLREDQGHCPNKLPRASTVEDFLFHGEVQRGRHGSENKVDGHKPATWTSRVFVVVAGERPL